MSNIYFLLSRFPNSISSEKPLSVSEFDFLANFCLHRRSSESSYTVHVHARGLLKFQRADHFESADGIMPSEIMDFQGVSSSFFSEDVPFSDGRHVGFWKTDAMRSNFYGTKTDGTLSTLAPSSFEKRTPLNPQIAKGFERPDYCLTRDRRANPSLEKLAPGSGRAAASLSLPRAFGDNLGSASFFTGGYNIMGAQYDNGILSNSLSELFTRKLRLSSNNTQYGHSVGAAANPHEEEEEPIESLKELEAQTIGDLLPDDDDDLFSGVADGIDYKPRFISKDELEDLDLFCSGGGIDLEEDGSSPEEKNSESLGGNSNNMLEGSNGTIGGEHPFGENPSRTLFVRNINSNVEDCELRALFELYGDIRTLYTACKHRGFVMISYYDIRAAWNAMEALQNKALRRRKLDIHFSIPKDNPSEKDVNQGTLVVFNLDSSVSDDELRQIFGVYGEVKEIRDISHHKFIEFYDVRAAEAALRGLNGSEIAGKRIKIEPSRPGSAKRSIHPFSSELDQDESDFYSQQSSPSKLTSEFSGSLSQGGVTSNLDNGSALGSRSIGGPPMIPYLDNAFHIGLSSSVPKNLHSMKRVASFGSYSNSNGEAGNSHGQLTFGMLGTSNFNHSLPDYDDGLPNGALGKSSGNMIAGMSATASDLLKKPMRRISSIGRFIEQSENGYSSSPSSGHHYMWSNSHLPQPQSSIWSNSAAFASGTSSAHTQQLHTVARAPSQLSNGLVSMNMESAPSVNPTLWERQHAYAGEAPDTSAFHPGSVGSMRMPGNSPHFMDFIPHSMYPHGGSCVDLSVPTNNVQMNSHNQRSVIMPARGQMIPMMSSFDPPNERNRGRRNEGSSNQGDNKKQFELDLDRIMRGEDKRTTLMIKNIPNKYTSKMLLTAIDERHKGTYDFLYLPIDFKNKCNVGYAFINMTDPSSIIPLYQAFNGQKWEKFNSEKVASLAYARIQGKAALIAHFQNSSLMNEDKRCRPILFHTDGPNAGDQVPFPMGVNIRPRPNKNRSSTNEENNQEGAFGEESINRNSSSASLKDLA